MILQGKRVELERADGRGNRPWNTEGGEGGERALGYPFSEKGRKSGLRQVPEGRKRTSEVLGKRDLMEWIRVQGRRGMPKSGRGPLKDRGRETRNRSLKKRTAARWLCSRAQSRESIGNEGSISAEKGEGGYEKENSFSQEGGTGAAAGYFKGVQRRKKIG